MSGGTVQLHANDHRAIEIFEEGVEKESHGLMSEAVELYRRAFKMNDQVDMLYRTHKLPQKAKQAMERRGKNAVKVDEELVKKINVDDLLDSFAELEISTTATVEIHNDVEEEDVVSNGEDDQVTEGKAEKLPIDQGPPSPLLKLPNDVWINILEILLVINPESWFNYSITCKKNAYLGLRTAILWEKVCNLVYPFQKYEENQEALTVATNDDDLPFPKSQRLIVPQYGNTWKQMLSARPFIKFCGCYISVVNYYSEGGRTELSSSWANPVRLITYYRYLRFYPDGKCIKLLTSVEPKIVVPQFLKDLDTLLDGSSHSTKVYKGSWTINGEGQLHVLITEGSVPTYNFHYYFNLKTLGPIFRHNKLIWDRYYAKKKVTDWADDDLHTFSLKNEKPFTFLRVRSYHEQLRLGFSGIGYI